MRRLQSARRRVPLDQSDEYLHAWRVVQKTVERVGGRAWLFRGAAHEDHFLEFIEWAEPGAAPLEDAGVVRAINELETFAPAVQVEDWEEAG